LTSKRRSRLHLLFTVRIYSELLKRNLIARKTDGRTDAMRHAAYEWGSRYKNYRAIANVPVTYATGRRCSMQGSNVWAKADHTQTAQKQGSKPQRAGPAGSTHRPPFFSNWD